MDTDEIEVLQKIKIEKELKTEVAPGCCGGAPTINEDACCKSDEDKKAVDEAGCGCSTSTVILKSSCC